MFLFGQILLDVKKIFEEQPSLVHITVKDVSLARQWFFYILSIRVTQTWNFMWKQLTQAFFGLLSKNISAADGALNQISLGVKGFYIKFWAWVTLTSKARKLNVCIIPNRRLWIFFHVHSYLKTFLLYFFRDSELITLPIQFAPTVAIIFIANKLRITD